jgi:hypothetical protein
MAHLVDPHLVDQRVREDARQSLAFRDLDQRNYIASWPGNLHVAIFERGEHGCRSAPAVAN